MIKPRFYLLEAGSSLILSPGVAPWSVGIHPGPSGSVSVEISTSPIEEVEWGSAQWVALEESPISEPTIIAYPAPVTGIRVQATGANARIEMVV